MSQFFANEGFDVSTVPDDDQAIELIDTGIAIDALVTDNAFHPGRRDAKGAIRILDHLSDKDILIPTISFGNEFMKYLGVEANVTFDLLKGDFDGLRAALKTIKDSRKLIG